VKVDDGRPTAPGDEELVTRIVESFTPPPLTPAQQVAFDDRLWGRIEKQKWRSWRLAPALAAALAIAAIVGFAVLRGEYDEPPVVAAMEGRSSSWEQQLLRPPELTDGGAEDDWTESGSLPEDYVAIASVFLDD
jgi:anti-sigma-K factor RskA